jgi:hypothetical protein
VLSAWVVASSASAQAPAPVRVDAGSFVRAETDRYFADIVARNGLGVVVHGRAPTSVDDQPIIRMNLDTLYSSGVFDLEAAPVTVTIPDSTDGRYLAVQVVSEDHYTPAVLHEGAHTLTAERVGTRYAALLIRVFVDPDDPADLTAAHAAQDAIGIEQDTPGAFEVPAWDQASLDKARQALLELGALGLIDGARRMGRPDEVDPIAHLLATAAGWGLNPETEAIYVGIFPERNDGVTVHRMMLRDVPVDGFWSVSVYNADGFFEKNDLGAYAVNTVTAEPGTDGTVTVQFGGCMADTPNCLPITESWNYVLRLYRPRPEVLSGAWTPPSAEAID